jgi:hypothetical protein
MPGFSPSFRPPQDGSRHHGDAHHSHSQNRDRGRFDRTDFGRGPELDLTSDLTDDDDDNYDDILMDDPEFGEWLDRSAPEGDLWDGVSDITADDYPNEPDWARADRAREALLADMEQRAPLVEPEDGFPVRPLADDDFYDRGDENRDYIIRSLHHIEDNNPDQLIDSPRKSQMVPARNLPGIIDLHNKARAAGWSGYIVTSVDDYGDPYIDSNAVEAMQRHLERHQVNEQKLVDQDRAFRERNIEAEKQAKQNRRDMWKERAFRSSLRPVRWFAKMFFDGIDSVTRS